jgi:hypothetical protein
MILTDDETKQLIISLGQSRGDKGFTEDEVWDIIDWATDVSIKSYMLKNVLMGNCVLDITNGEINYALTEKGRADKVLTSLFS